MKTLAIRIYESIRAEQRPRKAWFRVLQFGVTIAVLLYVYQRLKAEADLFEAQEWLQPGLSWGLVLLTLALMPLNLGLETAKWFRMVRPLYPGVRFLTLYQAIFTGMATGIFTPNRVGEYAGRVMSLPSGKRVEAATYTLVDRVMQMIITLWMGLGSLSFLLYAYPETIRQLIPLSPATTRLLLGGLLTLNVILLSAWLSPHRWVRGLKLDRSAHVFFQKVGLAVLQLEGKTLREVLGLGILRYAVFSLQYVCMLTAFGYDGPIFLALALVALVFIAKSLVPSIALTELGVRESVALVVMGSFGIGAFAIVSSTFLLFGINVILPALIGLLFVYRIRV